jgi:hypothetical protein
MENEAMLKDFKYKKYLNYFSLFTLLFALGCKTQTASGPYLLSDNFSEETSTWKSVKLSNEANGELKIDDGQLQLVADTPMIGAYHQQSFAGHFLVEAEIEADKNVGLVVMQEKNGEPDVRNWTMICVDQNEQGQVVVSVKDCQNGKYDVLDNTGLTNFNPPQRSREDDDEEEDEEETKIHIGSDLYEHVLTGIQYSVPFTETDKKIRIFKETNGGFFHFYYAVRQTIHGKEVSDWMELRPSKDWANPDQRFYVALVALDKGEAVFNSISVIEKPKADLDDRNTGFKVTQREFNWSGFYGDALVVSFDQAFSYHEKDIKFTFWTEMNYIPAWHIDNQLLYTYEFVETWGGGEPGCHEPMSDRLRRWTSVNVIEDNPVRKVIHWHYVLCNPDYRYPHNDKGEQAPEVDEYYTFYPDGSGTRHITYTPKMDTDFRAPHELGELISLAGSQTNSGLLHARPALTMLNLDGDVRQAHPGPKFDYYSDFDDWKQQILAVHLTNGPDVFCVFSSDPEVPETYSGYKIRYENAWQRPDINPVHWPVNKRPYTRPFSSGGTWDAEVSHACLLSWGVRDGIEWTDHYKVDQRGRKFREWVALIGLDEPNALESIKNKTRSWLFPGDVKVAENAGKFVKIDFQKKSLVFDLKGGSKACQFTLEMTDKGGGIINPAIEIQSWGTSEIESIQIDGKEVQKSKYRTYLTSDGHLLLWIEGNLSAGANVVIQKA